MTPERKQAALKAFEEILRRASQKHASDLHLKAGLPPIVRVNGSLFYLAEDAKETVSRLTNEHMLEWAYALMATRQKERYEAGEEVDLGFEVPGAGRFRINLCQQRGNPRLVCRYIPDSIRTIKDLDLPPVVTELTNAQRGLILVTGATGSGKSTTLAALIDQIARTQSTHIITIEDPIEFVFKDRKSIVTQREVGLDTRSFAYALKYALRQDPDVILVGEMRDEETIQMALNAAETGHLVFSTLHTVDAAETINRILGTVNGGMQTAVRAQLASVLVGVLSQRLLRSADGKGRIAALEILLSNQRVRDMISDPARTIDLHRAIEDSADVGMQTFDQGLMKLVREGKITKEEALLNCSNVRDFQMRLEGVVSGDWMAEPQEKAANRAQQVQQAMDNKNLAIEIESFAHPVQKKKK